MGKKKGKRFVQASLRTEKLKFHSVEHGARKGKKRCPQMKATQGRSITETKRLKSKAFRAKRLRKVQSRKGLRPEGKKDREKKKMGIKHSPKKDL